LTGKIFAIKKYSLHDGPGIRTTVFLKGCPLTCWWCHNPEGINVQPEFIYILQKCLRCGDCTPACPHHAIQLKDNLPVTNAGDCELCGSCLEVCPTGAREIVGEEITVDQLMQEIESDRVFYDESGGGVTFSGGEPFMQPQFLEALLQTSKARNLHTAVDTSGFVDTAILRNVSKYVDLFLYDIKMMNNERHRTFTGVSNSLIFKNLKWIVSAGKRVIVRVPLIPGINDDLKNMEHTADFIATLGGIERVDILPYFAESADKYRRLNRMHKMNDVKSPSNGDIEIIKTTFESYGLAVVIGG